jgi:hypothetical protein
MKAINFSLSLVLICLFPNLNIAQSPFKDVDDHLLARGQAFNFWEATDMRYSKEYYVDQGHPNASDENSGTERRPFKTITKAADVLMPGERVFIKQGVYRERITPKRGGTTSDRLISYEAFPDHEVIVKGSIVIDQSRLEQKGTWQYGFKPIYNEETDVWEYGLKSGERMPLPVWQFTLAPEEIGLYNPFAMMNILHDRAYLQYKSVKMKGHFRRRGLIFLNGDTLEQVFTPVEMALKKSGAYWIEHNGQTIHIRFPDGTQPGDHLIEATVKEQLFAPDKYGLAYIKVKGIHFQHTGNGFPVPQRGMVSSNRGNHWIIEDCTLEWANSLGMDLGNESWHTIDQPGLGHHIVRRNIFRNCGLSGLQAMRAHEILVEDNLFERIGWQDSEHGWEAGGIKFHLAKNCLIRRNVFRNITYAPGIWLDYLSTDNCRITKNVFSDITTARGCIYLEVSRKMCLVDHNIFHKTHSQYWISGDYGAGGSALYTDGTDSIRFENNLMLNIENSGYGAYLNASRLVKGRGGITRYHSIKNNIFVNCQKYAVELPNSDHFLENNVYSFGRAGYLKMAGPPELFLDLKTWQQLYGWDKGSIADLKIKEDLNTDLLELSLEMSEADAKRLQGRGPLKEYHLLKKVKIDPRVLKQKD